MANDRTVEEYFEGKPGSREIFDIVAATLESFGPCGRTIGSQISWGRTRKFAWFWLYNVTKKNPDGVPHLMLALDHQATSDHARNVEQIGQHRWNHQIVIRTADDARSDWLTDLVQQAYDYATVDPSRSNAGNSGLTRDTSAAYAFTHRAWQPRCADLAGRRSPSFAATVLHQSRAG